MKYISDAATRMRFLIKGLLDYSRIGREGEVTAIDLNELLVEIQDNVAFHISKTNTIINVDDLPVINGYRSELALLFQNLISNAIKFRKKNIPPQIKITVQKELGQWRFSVEDNGISIPNEHKEKIFKIYQRLHNRSEYEGSGIGLAHCQKIVELHGGKIWVDSKHKVGSTFYFTIVN